MPAITPLLRVASLALAVLLLGGPAGAHPHVWISTRAELVFAADGKLTAVRHHWTFDEAYSAFSVQGLDKNGDGRTTPDELVDLARTNLESLAEFGYFTSLKANGAKQAFGPPGNERMSYEDGRLTFDFDMPLKTPANGRLVVLEVYDPTFFVDFSTDTAEAAVKLVGAPSGCALTVTRPKPLPVSDDKVLPDEFFRALTASSSTQFSSRALVACP